MLIGENILLALNGLRANKMRSLLTMLGIIIGIASVIAIMTLGDSISSSVTDSMASMGANNITVGVSQKSTSQETTSSGMTFSMGPRFTKMTEDDYISDEMLDSLEERYGDSIQGFSLTESVGSGTVQLGSLYAYVNATGVNEANLENTDLTLLAGRTLTERDQIEAKKVCLVSDYLVNNLFNGNNMAAVGQTVDVLFNSRYYTYTIVGVYKYEESDMGFSSSSEEDTETTLYLPLQTAKNQTHNTNGYSQFTILTASGVSATIAAIGGISLLVGGIGVMNIMLVSITERTREIGTRKALGATNGSIRLQFITESIVICIVGGMLGMILGMIIATVATNMMGYAVSPSVTGIVVSVSFSILIGVFFGYYPANKAAQLNPIEALRYE